MDKMGRKVTTKKLIVGLGNPGEEYTNTRHNAGAMLADQLAQHAAGNVWRIEKADTYMNESGKAVRKLVDFYKVSIENLYIAYDDLDIPLGSYKISKGKSPRVHNGIKSVVESLGSDDFWHVRIGIDNRINRKKSAGNQHPDKSDLSDFNRRTGISGKEYVLQNFTEEERGILEEVMGRIQEDIRGRI